MAEYARRPAISNIEIRCLVDGSMTTKKGPDLNSVLRGVLVQLRNSMGITTSELARRVGVKQQSMSGLLSDAGDRGFTLTLVSQICAAMQIDIGELFSQHPQYGASEGEEIAALKAVTDKKQRVALGEALHLCSSIGIVDAQIEQMRVTAEAIKASTEKVRAPTRRKKSR